MKNTKFNKRYFGIRIIVSPFVFMLLFITHNLFVLRRFWHFLKFGGEYVNFEENEKATIQDIYNELKKQSRLREMEKEDIL